MTRLLPGNTPDWPVVVVMITLQLPMGALADGVVVDKIYDPYVQPLETEIEYRFIGQRDDQFSDAQKHLLGIGRSMTDRWAVEFYAIALKSANENLSVDAYEFEAKWQLTEQGEYAADWGLLFEIEREIEENAWEVSTQVLASRDIGRITATVNLGLIYEWGRDVQDEFETSLRAQARYRFKEAFEPAIELHVGQNTRAIGPAITGLYRVSSGKKLRWELGVFAGIDDKSPDQIFKANIEFEF